MRQAELGAFLVNGALYRQGTIDDAEVAQYPSGVYCLSVPEVVDRECASCGPTKWQQLDRSSYGTITEGGLRALTFRCRNCDDATFLVWMYWRRHGTTAIVVKAGQYPKFEIAIPKDFEKALGARRALYVKGMTLRHSNYGIGALTYFRRVIEDTTDEMLALLEETMKATGADPAAIGTLQKAKGGTRFEDKVKIAAKVIPTNLRPGGVNPFGDLYELVSIGLHDLTDEQCCDIVDAMDKSLRFIYTQLKTHAEDAKAYEGAVKDISVKLQKLKKKE